MSSSVLFHLLLIQTTILCFTDSQFFSGANLSSVLSYLSANSCPCKKPPRSTQCLNYDPQYAASTLDEVISNFVDTTTADASKAKTVLGKEPAYRNLANKAAFKCDTPQCLGCLQLISDRMIQSMTSSSSFGGDQDAGWMNKTVDALLQGASALGLGKAKKYVAYCPALLNTPSYLAPPNGTRRNIIDIASILNISTTKGGKPEIRPKRQSAPPTTVDPGTSSPLKCDYRRGDPEDSNPNYCGLCNICWSIRTLSDKYFPRYINEKTCDQSDNKCLSGYGSCKEIYRSIDVLYNSGTDDAPQWTQYSLNTPVSCECQVQKDSAMYSIVK